MGFPLFQECPFLVNVNVKGAQQRAEHRQEKEEWQFFVQTFGNELVIGVIMKITCVEELNVSIQSGKLEDSYRYNCREECLP